MRLIGNVEKDAQVRAVASGALPSGDTVIVNANGTVSVVAGTSASIGSEAVFNAATAYFVQAAFDSNSNKVVIAYRDDGNSRKGTAIVGTVSGTSITFGSDVVFDPSTEARPFSVVFDSNANKVVISFIVPDTNASSIVGTVSGNSISFGSSATFTTNTVIDLDATFDSNSNKVVIVYRDETDSNRGRAVVGTVSGTSISFGGSSNFTTSTTTFVAVTFDSSNNKVVAAIRDGSNSNYGTAFVGTVSGNSISFGTGVVFESATTNYPAAAFDTNLNKVLIFYSDGGNSNYGTAIVGTVSGTSISFGTATVFESGGVDHISAAYDSTSQSCVISYQDQGNSNYGTYVVGTVSGTSISFGTPAVFNSGTTSYTATVFDSNSNKVVISYQDQGNSNYGTSVVVAPGSTNLTSENFLGFAAHTYADTQSALVNSTCTVDRNQTSLTAGQTYYVQTDGSLGTTAADPSVVAGTAISSTEIIVKG